MKSDFAEIMEDTMSSTITEMFNSFQDFLNNEQEVREVRITRAPRGNAWLSLGYVVRQVAAIYASVSSNFNSDSQKRRANLISSPIRRFHFSLVLNIWPIIFLLFEFKFMLSCGMLFDGFLSTTSL